MCGIAGVYWQDEPARREMVEAMCSSLRHRGPDEGGTRTDGGCGLGMRRLSIIDLSTGNQPISNEDGTIWVVFNGEIYNYQPLRDELAGRGHRFATNSDTETLVHLYEEYGVDGLRRLRGMFAFALWDAPRQRLLLARDRFGKKPLYYAIRGDKLYFASELKALRAAGLDLETDREALRWYFLFSYVPEPATCFRGVSKLPPASWLTFEPGRKLNQGTYWRLPPAAGQAPEGWREEDACERLRELFDESVRIRLMSDVPLGAFLSGGIDSSLVVASMARQTAQPVRTFSIGFREADFNETGYARMVARQYGTEHQEILVQPDSIRLVENLAAHLDEPFADSSAIPTYLVSEFTARHVKVALSGDGGDELFGGYRSFFQVEKLRRWDRVPQPLRRFLGFLAERLPYSAYGKNYLRAVSRPVPLDRYVETTYMPYFFRRQLLEPEWMLPAESGFLAGALAGSLPGNGSDPLTEAMYFEATSKLAGDILVKVDRMSMANSLEVRCPLLDHELAEFAATLPHTARMRHGRGKRILLQALGGRLPPELLDRPKRGFGIPLARWFRTSLRPFLHEHLLGTAFLSRQIVSEPFLRHVVAEHERGRRDNSHWLWHLLMLELWFRSVERA